MLDQWVVVVQVRKNGRIVCVDGVFTKAADAESHADKYNLQFEHEKKFEARVELVMRPQ